jgi:hypothetical protein
MPIDALLSEIDAPSFDLLPHYKKEALMNTQTLICRALMVAILLAGISYMADAAPSKKFRVQITINGQDDITGNLAKLVQEEAVALTDMELVTEKPEWTLELIGVAPRNEKKEPVIFLVSVMATQNFPQQYWNGVYGTLAEAVLQRQHEQSDKGERPYIPNKKKVQQLQPAWTSGPSRPALETATKDMVRKQAHYVEGGNDLRVIAKKIVDTFNQNQLDPRRKNRPAA